LYIKMREAPGNSNIEPVYNDNILHVLYEHIEGLVGVSLPGKAGLWFGD
jgi:hypothetical protein